MSGCKSVHPYAPKAISGFGKKCENNFADVKLFSIFAVLTATQKPGRGLCGWEA